jgi:IS5 family transposase
MPSGKRKRHKVATHKRKRARANRHKRKVVLTTFSLKFIEMKISIQSSNLSIQYTDYLNEYCQLVSPGSIPVKIIV